jgi:hypothetical protein
MVVEITLADIDLFRNQQEIVCQKLFNIEYNSVGQHETKYSPPIDETARSS